MFWGIVFLWQCAMCQASVEGAGEASLRQSLNLGILFLLVPPLALFCAIFRAVYKSQQEESED